MTDVAKLANVSASTVSLYLRRPEEVSEALGRRIHDAIDTLGYVPNLNGQFNVRLNRQPHAIGLGALRLSITARK